MAQAYPQRGKAYSILDRRGQAIQDFHEAIRLDPQNAQASFSRGGSLDVLGEYQRAKSDYDEAIRLNLKSDESTQVFAKAKCLGYDP